MSVMHREIDAVPVAVLDFETTGLSPTTGSRVIEIGIVRIEPGRDPTIVLDTLVNPEGPVYATEIHGISDDDVVGAPTFGDIAALVVDALDGAVVLAYNASFDIRFLRAELMRAARGSEATAPPHLCLMWLRPLLGLGKRASLSATCQAFGLPIATHTAADDATVSAQLWLRYAIEARRSGIHTFTDLADCGTHKYLKTLATSPYRDALGAITFVARAGVALKARPGRLRVSTSSTIPQRTPVVAPAPALRVQEDLKAVDERFGDPSIEVRRRAYWHALIDMLSDKRLSQEEVRHLRSERDWLELGETDVRALHSRYVGQRLLEMAEDHTLEGGETTELRDLFGAMRELGWAPGD